MTAAKNRRGASGRPSSNHFTSTQYTNTSTTTLSPADMAYCTSPLPSWWMMRAESATVR